jgi:hypothetical protein
MTEEKTTQAKDCKCSDCKKQAVAFWPVCDPDIPSYPYCRKCLDERKYKLMTRLYKINNK